MTLPRSRLEDNTLADEPYSNLTDPDNWRGGFYELALELGDADDQRLKKAVETLCARAQVDGWYALGVAQPVADERMGCSLESLADAGHLRGVALLPNGKRLVCGLLVTRETSDAGANGPDWLSFYIPLGALSRSDSRAGAYPFGDLEESLLWRRPIDDWLAELGRKVYEEVPFRLGIIGSEVSGQAYWHQMQWGVPADRADGYLIPDANELRYYPATK